nr:unnamed protein product [Callosobruchus chinensis]
MTSHFSTITQTDSAPPI